MQHPFVSLWEKPSRLVVGLMSGTSADGVDAALTRITGSGLDSRVEQLGFYFQPFDDATRQEILAVCGGDFGGSREICLLGTHLGKLYAQAVRELLKKTGTERIDLIGCHGQTVWHIPEQTPYLGGTVRGTLQIGDPSYLAEEFGCPVVSDFRIRDMAAGGLGAPLVPYTEFLLYRSETEDVALQNIGGIGNVTLLPAGCTLEEVTAAAKAAHIHSYISRLPDGYNTVINEDGLNISQGQKQLLTIARAILSDPKILILDEATSSVDTRTEIQIQKAMDNLMRGRTSFIIAHRLSTIRNADLILCMKDGDIVEQGTHDELMEKNGFYANLYNSQFEQAEESA